LEKREQKAMSEMYDITIIGGGPAGLFAGFYAGMRTAKTQIIESLPQVGGQAAALYPEKMIYDVGGYAGVKAGQLAKELEEQARLVNTEIRLNETVMDVQKQAEFYHVTTNRGEYDTKALLLATGNGAFNPRKLAVENVEQLENQKVFYHVPDLDHFADQDVLIAGGGDSAIDIALMLEPIAKSVSLVHRRDQFRAMERNVQQLQASTVQIMTPFLISNVQDAKTGLDVQLKEIKTEALKQTHFDRLIVNYGFTSSNKIIKGWQLELEQEHRMFAVDHLMQTSQPNVYAIGDGVEYPGKLRLIATAFGEGPVAVDQIMNNLYPGKRGPVHSTSMFEK
jgi:thioredoxin reductase